MKEIGVKKQTALTYYEVALSELPEEYKKLLQQAENALENAYAPYSMFRVGASVLLENGEVIIGNNQENAAYPSGLCAERVALFAAKAQYPDVAIKALAVTARSNTKELLQSPVTPCGSCRQVMAEYEKYNAYNFPVILGGSEDVVWVVPNASDLLPLTFAGEGIKRE
ncbi:MAG: cytidine deaminase [Crocinitomicaceae bacterium]|nr:cytidine deaminase [Crocinitomicaceae bacterium]|tara:strand:- start:811 stop:1314 length:504 start_codon:yes stop_codon:yes gene_type:complete